MLLQILLLGRLCGEWTNLGLHAVLELGHYQLAVLNLRLHVLELLLQLLDDVEVLLSDVIVILFHLTEGVLVVDHEIVNVLVLALLNLVDLNLHAKGQLALQALHLRIILLNQSLFVRLELLLKDLEVLFVLVRLSLDLADVGLVVPFIILLLVCLAISVVFLRHLMVGVLFGHDFSAFHLHVSDVLLVLVLVVLHFL